MHDRATTFQLIVKCSTGKKSEQSYNKIHDHFVEKLVPFPFISVFLILLSKSKWNNMLTKEIRNVCTLNKLTKRVFKKLLKVYPKMCPGFVQSLACDTRTIILIP